MNPPPPRSSTLPEAEEAQLARALGDEERSQLASRLPFLAWRWYRIPADVAEDIVQSALLTYVEVKDRYPRHGEHRVILVGIFRNKCREYIAKDIRSVRGMRSLKEAARTGHAEVSALPGEATPEDGVLHELVHREDGSIILSALGELKPRAREMFRLIVEEGYSRHDLIERYGINKNTLDSRLHACRNELREILAERGVRI